MGSTKGFGGFKCFFGVKILASNSIISKITICLKLFTNDSMANKAGHIQYSTSVNNKYFIVCFSVS